MRSKTPRCLMYYPWNLDDRTGALAVLLAYSRALQEVGFRIDCFAPHAGAGEQRENGRVYGVFENLFSPPCENEILLPLLEMAAITQADDMLPSKAGRDETAMSAAGVLASIADYDIIGIHYTRCYSLKRVLPSHVKTILFTHDLDSVVAQQEEAIYGIQSHYTIEAEVDRLRKFDLVTVLGPGDLRRIQEVDAKLPVVEAPFCPGALEKNSVRPASPGTLLWISAAAAFHGLSFDWFWRHVWPRIREARPETRLIVAGQVSALARRLEADRDLQVSVLGVVPNAQPLYDESDVLVAPYYYGDGVKTKIIDALARGLPVVTTSPGLSNTRLTPDREVLVADVAELFARRVMDLLDSPDRRAELAARGREYIDRWHNPATAYQPLQRAACNLLKTQCVRTFATSNAQRHLYDSLKHLVPWVIHRCWNSNIERVAVYGAGTHTRMLLPIWRSLGGPEVEAIIVSESGANRIFLGLPVIAASEFDASKVDAMVLSSQGFELEMEASCHKLWPELPVYSIWRPPTVRRTPKRRIAETYSAPLVIDTTVLEQIPEAILAL